MKSVLLKLALSASILCITGCVGGIASAVKAYATTAEEHATVMGLTFDRCMKEQDQAAKEVACNSVKSSIDAYHESASELKSIKVSE